MSYSPAGDPSNAVRIVDTSGSLHINSTATTSAPFVINTYPGATTSTITIGHTQSAGTVYAQPISISTGGYIWADPVPVDEIKSKPSSTEEHAHNIQCRLRVETTKVISEYFCHHCEEVLFSKVISRLPKSINKKKCLSRIVKGV
jgi:hypothetical protein